MIRVHLPNSTVNFPKDVSNFLTTYQFLMIFTAITGNSIVVYASRKYKALHLDSSSVLLIQNLAITDIILVLVAYVPKFVTLLYGRWVMGRVICYVTAFSQFVPGAVEILTLTVITLYRWYVVRFPYRNPPNMFYTKIIICSIWILALANPLVFVTANKSMAIFDVRALACVTTVAKNHLTLVIAFSIFFGILPVITTVLFNLLTLASAFWMTSTQVPQKKIRNKQALVTVSAICWVFVLSWLPYLIRIMAMMLSTKKLPLWFFTVQYNLNILSLTLNPIIYTLTNRKFRKFLNRRIMRLKQAVRNTVHDISRNTRKYNSGSTQKSQGKKGFINQNNRKISCQESIRTRNCCDSFESFQMNVESVSPNALPDSLIICDSPGLKSSKCSKFSMTKLYTSFDQHPPEQYTEL